MYRKRTVYEFHEYCDGSNPNEGLPISITRPNGEVLTLLFDKSGYGDGRGKFFYDQQVLLNALAK